MVTNLKTSLGLGVLVQCLYSRVKIDQHSQWLAADKQMFTSTHACAKPVLPVQSLCLSYVLTVSRSPEVRVPHWWSHSSTRSWINMNCSCNTRTYNTSDKHLTELSLTAVWKIIFMRGSSSYWITPDTSTIFSFSTCSRMVSIAMNVPVRPTPALYGSSDWNWSLV